MAAVIFSRRELAAHCATKRAAKETLLPVEKALTDLSSGIGMRAEQTRGR